MNYEIPLGSEVVAIAKYTFSEIKIFGMGKLVDYKEEDEAYVVEIEIDDKKALVECELICELKNWAELVNDTDAEVIKIIEDL